MDVITAVILRKKPSRIVGPGDRIRKVEDFVVQSAVEQPIVRGCRSALSSGGVRTGAIEGSFARRQALFATREGAAGTGAIPPVSIELASLLEQGEGNEIRARIVTSLQRVLPAGLRWIVTDGGEDSRALAELTRRTASASGLYNVDIVSVPELEVDPTRLLGGGHAFVVAAVSYSGRTLRNISRILRTRHEALLHRVRLPA